MVRFILYTIIFYLVIKALNAFFRWLKQPHTAGKSPGGNSSSSSKNSKYKDIEDAQFTEIKSNTKKEKVKEKAE